MSSSDKATPKSAPAPRRTHARNHKARAREESITRILDAAEQLFAEFGYHGVTLKDVAARVGVSSTLIHYHFKGKESIYEAVWARRAPLSARNRLEAMRRYAEETALATWYSHVDEETTRLLRRGRSRSELEALFAKARQATSATALPALAQLTRAGEWRIVDHPPVVSHDGIGEHEARLRRLFATYRETLTDDRRVLLDRFELRDFAMKVVGVGSVGTRCFVALLASDVDEPLFLQVKEAQASALDAFVARDDPVEEGRRVVSGQRLMQADSDIFLGWAEADGRDFYVRQLRDMKGSANFATMRPGVFRDYLELCGLTLARAHARSGSAPEIGGYLGRGPAFDDAITRFAVAYADQTAADHRALRDAVRSGRIDAGPS